MRARIAVERGRPWQAAFWIQTVQQLAISLACAKRGLPHHGRGVDELPADVLARLAQVDMASQARDEQLRALRAAMDVLVAEAGDASPLLDRVAAPLDAILSP
ncbi:MAG: hypothetical protein R3F05_02660 [Planctomycetota bacterium]